MTTKDVADEIVDAETKITDVAEYDPIASGLADLRKEAATEWNLETVEGDKAARKFRASCVTLRTSLTKAAKDLKKPHQDKVKLLGAEHDRLIELIKEIEKPVDEKIKAVEVRKEQEREAKRAAEQKRVEAILSQIREMRELPESCVGQHSQFIKDTIGDHRAVVINDAYAEFQDRAKTVHEQVSERLASLLESALASEQAAAELAKQQAELKREQEAAAEERRKAEVAQAERDRIAREQQDAIDQANAKIERERQDLEEAKAAQARREQEEQDRIAQEKLARERAEADRIAAEKQKAIDAAAEKKRLTDEKKAQKAEAARLAELAKAQRLASVGEAGYDLAKAVYEVGDTPDPEAMGVLIEQAYQIIQTVEQEKA